MLTVKPEEMTVAAGGLQPVTPVACKFDRSVWCKLCHKSYDGENFICFLSTVLALM